MDKTTLSRVWLRMTQYPIHLCQGRYGEALDDAPPFEFGVGCGQADDAVGHDEGGCDAWDVEVYCFENLFVETDSCWNVITFVGAYHYGN